MAGNPYREMLDFLDSMEEIRRHAPDDITHDSPQVPEEKGNDKEEKDVAKTETIKESAIVDSGFKIVSSRKRTIKK